MSRIPSVMRHVHTGGFRSRITLPLSCTSHGILLQSRSFGISTLTTTRTSTTTTTTNPVSNQYGTRVINTYTSSSWHPHNPALAHGLSTRSHETAPDRLIIQTPTTSITPASYLPTPTHTRFIPITSFTHQWGSRMTRASTHIAIRGMQSTLGRRSFASQGRDDRDRGGMSMTTFQVLLTILRFIFRMLPWIWKSPFVQNLRMRHPYFFYGVVLAPAGFGLVFVLTHIEIVPYSNRVHLTFLGRSSEMQLGAQAYNDIVTREHARILPHDHPTTVAVREIASNLLQICIADGIIKPPAQGQPLLAGPSVHGHKNDIDPAWEVNVIESNVANAFVLPNGKIFVYTGLLPITQTTGGLASVLGHEISHQLGRHAIEKMGIMALLLLGYELVQGYRDASGQSGRGLGGMIANFMLATLVQVGLPLAHSRKMETEADHIGMTLMSRAAYDPSTAIGVWERMKIKEQGKKTSHDVEEIPQQMFGGKNWRVRGAELLSTHPASDTRIANMQKWLPTARAEYDRAMDTRVMSRLPIPNSSYLIKHIPLLPSSVITAMDEIPDSEGLTTSLRADRASSLMVGKWGQIFDEVLREMRR